MAISLSGGVDSMLIALGVHYLSERHGGLKLSALHINYGNREETDEEAIFVEVIQM